VSALPPTLAPKFPYNPSGAELPSAAPSVAARIIELAELKQQTAGQEMNIVLRDDTLGRVGLRLTERAGIVQTVIRSDSYQGAKVISSSIPALLDALTDRGMPVSSQIYAGTGDEPQHRPFDHHAGRGRQSRQGAKDGRRSGRSGHTFRLAVR
jgi:flagellar hook-length control protein FliK